MPNKTKTIAPTIIPYRFIASLAALSLVSISLLTLRIQLSDSSRYIFLLWNLVLAVIPLLLAWWLVMRIRKHGWLRPKQLLLTLLWLVFLPNSFYLISDFVHLRQTYEASLLYDIVMLKSFVVAGLVMGYASVYMVHRQLTRRLAAHTSWALISIIFLLSSFAIYLGRFTDWNSWDIVFKPAGLLFDVSDRFINPAIHGETYLTTVTFFVLLLVGYWVVWEAARLVRSER